MKFFSYRYLPLNTYIAYCLFAMSCLFLSPIIYLEINYLVLVAYVGLIVFVFSLGYIAGAKGVLFDRRQTAVYVAYEAYQPIRRLLLFLVACSSIYIFQQWWHVFSAGGIGLDLTKLGESYVKYYEGYERGQAKVNFAYILNILMQSSLTLTLFFGAFYFRQMPQTTRWLFLFIIVSYVLINVVVSGKQKFFGDVVIIVIFLFLLTMARNQKKIKISKIMLAGSGLLFVFLIFVELLNQRYVAAGIGVHNIAEKAHPLTRWNNTSLWFDYFGDSYGFAIGVFLGYFTNGLYGLSLSLEMPFEWTYFVGNSYSLSRVVEIAFDGVSIIDKTYPVRVGAEYGWDLSKWHSLFSWLASDITFIGVVILAFPFGFLYGKLWVQAVSFANPYAGPLFLNLSLGLIFSLSNNQIMHGMAGVIALFVLVFYYFFYVLLKKSTR